MKAVMMSIQPKWCEFIASGKKTIEVRKTRPKLEMPFKCYIYCTKPKMRLIDVIRDGEDVYGETYHGKTKFIKVAENSTYSILCWEYQKVIGEFVCDKIYDITPHFDVPTFPNQYIFKGAQEKDSSCLSFEEINSYLKGNQGYGLHISDLVIYDEPKELNEFYKEDFEEILSNWEDLFSIGVPSGCIVQYPPEPKKEDYIVKRPPQSWCYVEELV